MSKKEDLKQQILQLTREYYHEVHKTSKVFEPGKSFVNYGGRYFNDEEMVNLVDSSLDFWLTASPWAHKFETRLAKWLGIKHCALTNSGSSANLLAFYVLTSPKLGDRRIRKGDEVLRLPAVSPPRLLLSYNMERFPSLWISLFRNMILMSPSWKKHTRKKQKL